MATAPKIESVGSPSDRRFYVYALIDPRDKKAFYIGKGTGDRMHDHEKEAKADRVTNGAKFKRIKEIQAAWESVQTAIIRDQLTETRALRLERRLIRRHAETLTNISLGNKSPKETISEECKLILKRWGDDVAPWLAAWHPDCIKGFGGMFEAACFYFTTKAKLRSLIIIG